MSSSDENDFEESDPDAPIHEQFWNKNFAQTRDSVCELDNTPTKESSIPRIDQKPTKIRNCINTFV